MILNTLIAFLVILGLLSGWIGVQHLARIYAARHPEFGPAREEGGSCLFCLCKDSLACPRRNRTDPENGPETTTKPIIPLENAHSQNQEQKS